MTTIHTPQALSAVLEPIHERWLRTVELNFLPAATPGVGFWDRWGMARFLADEFANFYRLEASLFEQLGSSLAPDAAARLRQGLGELERTRARLVGLGRRRGTGVEVARNAKAMLVAIRRWSAQLEAATQELQSAEVPTGCKELIDTLELLADGVP